MTPEEWNRHQADLSHSNSDSDSDWISKVLFKPETLERRRSSTPPVPSLDVSSESDSLENNIHETFPDLRLTSKEQALWNIFKEETYARHSKHQLLKDCTPERVGVFLRMYDVTKDESESEPENRTSTEPENPRVGN